MNAKANLVYILCIFLFSGCSFIPLIDYYKVVDEYDEVKNIRSKRLRIASINKGDKLNSFQQSIVRTSSSEGKRELKVFDLLKFYADAYPLEKEVYWIIDGQIFEITKMERNSVLLEKHVEDYETVNKTDSTTTQVLTGLRVVNYKYEKNTYTLSPEIVEALKTADEIKIRYYTQQSMVTAIYRQHSIAKLKLLVD